MSLQNEFEIWLDEAWPLWKRHEGGVKYHNMRRAFFAGFQRGMEGPLPSALERGHWADKSR